MSKRTIRVDDPYVEDAEVLNGGTCPVAQAAYEAFPEATHLWVTIDAIKIWTQEELSVLPTDVMPDEWQDGQLPSYILTLPMEAHEAVMHFDSSGVMDPFAFEIDDPFEVTP